MNKHTVSNIKLGIFVIAGLLFLILLLYMIGRNQNLFGSSFTLKARFENVQGLRSGNNIRYAGIQAGTVKKINILNDTTIEVVMLVDWKMKKYIQKSAIASIGTDGLMGNKLVNIIPSKQPAALVEDGDILAVRKTISTDDMLQSLAHTTGDIRIIAAELKSTIQRINNSTAAWKILNDNSLPENIRSSVVNVRKATAKADELVNNLNSIISDVKNGKGSLGAILTDSTMAIQLSEAIEKIKSVGNSADSLAGELSRAAQNVQNEITHGKGPVTALLKDSAMVKNINTSLDNIQKGTEGFNEILDAVKQSFLFRGYFRRLEKQKQKEAKQPADPR